MKKKYILDSAKNRNLTTSSSKLVGKKTKENTQKLITWERWKWRIFSNYIWYLSTPNGNIVPILNKGNIYSKKKKSFVQKGLCDKQCKNGRQNSVVIPKPSLKQHIFRNASRHDCFIIFLLAFWDFFKTLEETNSIFPSW